MESFILFDVMLVNKTFLEDGKAGKFLTEGNNREYRPLNILPIESIREPGDEIKICFNFSATQMC